MSSIFPLRETVSLDDEREPRLVEIDEDTADEVFEALSSQTTRTIFLELHNAPQTASDLADVTDTSVQNVQYHLEKLQDADLIEVVDTWYSERGSEMKVYAPQDESLVLFAGRDKQGSFRSLLNRIVGVLAFLVPTSALAGLIAAGPGELFGSLFALGSAGSSAPNEELRGRDTGDTAPGDGSQSGDSGTAPETATGGGDGGRTAGDASGQATPVTDSTKEAASGAEQTTPEVAYTTSTNATNSTEISINATNNTQIVTDGGQPPTQETLTQAADSTAEIAGMDPALAVAVAFFLGGLVVFASLSLWYGSPGTWR